MKSPHLLVLSALVAVPAVAMAFSTPPERSILPGPEASALLFAGVLMLLLWRRTWGSIVAGITARTVDAPPPKQASSRWKARDGQ